MITSDTTIRSIPPQELKTMLSVESKNNQGTANLWQWLAIGEALVIVFLLISLFRRKKKRVSKCQAIVDEAKAGEVDFKDVLSSAFHAETLYKKLIRVCHPDRFPQSIEPQKHVWATDITARLGEAQYSLKQLNELKVEIEKELGITIK